MPPKKEFSVLFFPLQISLLPNKHEYTGVGRVSLNYSSAEISSAAITGCGNLMGPSFYVLHIIDRKGEPTTVHIKHLVTWKPWPLIGRTGCMFQLMRRQGKREKTRAHCRPDREETHRCTMTLTWKFMETQPMNG